MPPQPFEVTRKQSCGLSPHLYILSQGFFMKFLEFFVEFLEGERLRFARDHRGLRHPGRRPH